MSVAQAIRFIRSHRRFLVTVHANIDGDALGAELAFSRLLFMLGKRCVCVNEDTVPYGYGFLPGLGRLRQYRAGVSPGAFDAMVVLDCSDMHRTGGLAPLAEGVPVLNIDHHVSNSRFGRVNWVEPAACCTCELVYELYRKMRVRVDKEAALALYAGVLTDTGSFRYTNTSSRTHAIASALLATGIDPSAVYKAIYSSVPIKDMRLLARILPLMKSCCGGKVVWFELSRALFKGNGPLSFDLSENLLNFARSIKGVEVAILFKENRGQGGDVRVNFRSQGPVDVNRLAASFGGGGHKSAAGVTIKGKGLAAVRASVVRRVREALP